MDKLAESLPEIIGAAAQSPLGMLALLSVALSVLAYVFFSGASEKVKVGIFVLLFLGVVGFAAALFDASPNTQGQGLADAPPAPSPGAQPAPALRESAETMQAAPEDGAQVRAGHLVFKLLSVVRQPYAADASGKPRQFSLTLAIRVTDIAGISGYVDRNTIRLAVDGAELLPENAINLAVYERQSVETDAVFIVPADATSAELLLGRPSEAMGRLPLDLEKPADVPRTSGGD